MTEPFFIKAVRELAPTLSFRGNNHTTLKSINEVDLPSKADIDAKIVELEADWTAQEYARNRQAEYPTIQELVVALYDTGDKSAIEAKRAEVKAKYPKPE